VLEQTQLIAGIRRVSCK